MRVALVHDWLTGMRGGEKVLEAIAEAHAAGVVVMNARLDFPVELIGLLSPLSHDRVEIGERTVIELGIHGLNPALVRMVGGTSMPRTGRKP